MEEADRICVKKCMAVNYADLSFADVVANHYAECADAYASGGRYLVV